MGIVLYLEILMLNFLLKITLEMGGLQQYTI